MQRGGFSGDNIRYWKDQKMIDKNNLVVAKEHERLFSLRDCRRHLEDMLAIYQSHGLNIHYMQDKNLRKDSKQKEIITYRAYANLYCSNHQRPNQKYVANVEIHYQLARLDQAHVQSKYPIILFFFIFYDKVKCQICSQYINLKIFQSSFYLLRTQFIYEIMPKVKFMMKYPNYVFTPNSFVSNKKAEQTPYEFINDFEYQVSLYFQEAEAEIASYLRRHLMKKDIDCQSVPFSKLQQMLNQSPQQQIGLSDKFNQRKQYLKSKYMCKNCIPKVIWSSRTRIQFKFCIVPMKQIPQINENQFIYDWHRKNINQSIANISKQGNNDKGRKKICQFYDKKEDDLDRSIQRDLKQYECWKAQFRNYGRWHQKLDQYSYPFYAFISVVIPLMPCPKCKVDKDGLIYVSDILQIKTSIIENITNTLLKAHRSKNKN